MRTGLALVWSSLLVSSLGTAQTPLSFELKGARFGATLQSFTYVQSASCLLEASALTKECPADFDCWKSARYRVATTGKGLGTSDLRRFYVVPMSQPEAMQCWGADLNYQPSHNHSAVGSAQFTVTHGGLSESGEIPVFVEGAEPALVPQEFCKSWTPGIGTPAVCKVSLLWQHPEHGGTLLGCAWSDGTQTLEKVEGCVPFAESAALARGATVAERDGWRNLAKGKTVDLELQSHVPWSKWREAFQHPFESRPRMVDVKAYYRLREGGPVQTQSFPIAFQVASPWYLLLACLFAGSALGSGLPLAAAFAQRKPIKVVAWVRTLVGVLVYGIAVWGILYAVEGRVGLMQTELRLNQAIPVLLFGLFIGFRGLGFVIDWIEKLLSPGAAKGLAFLLFLSGLAPGVQAASAPGHTPRQLLEVQGRLLVVTGGGIFPVEAAPDGAGQQQQQQVARPYRSEASALISFAQGALAGAAASGLVPSSGGQPQDVIFVSLLLPGGRIIIDEYLPDGRRRDNRMPELGQAPLDFTAAPTAMVWDAAMQRLYAASPRGTIWALPRNGPPQRLAQSTARISSFALDPASRRLFATDLRQGRVLMLDLNAPGAGLVAFANDQPLGSPESLAYDPVSKRLFVADEHRDAVFSIKVPPPPGRPLNVKWTTVVNKTYTYLRAFDFGDPVALAIVGGDLWIADRQARRVFPVDLKSGAQKSPRTLP